MKRVSNSPYKVELDTTSIKNVARETKHLDASFVENGNNITQAFVDYAKPLIGKLPVVGSFDELKR
jgi:6-phosphofructokinase 1